MSILFQHVFCLPFKDFLYSEKTGEVKELEKQIRSDDKVTGEITRYFFNKIFYNKPLFKLTVKSLKSLSVATSHEPFYALQHFLFYKSKVPVSKRSPWQLYNMYIRAHISPYHRCTWIKVLKHSTYYMQRHSSYCEFDESICETMTSHTLSNLHMSKT